MARSKGTRTIIVGQSREEWEIETIAESGLFDAEFYKKQAGIEATDAEALAHYVEVGERKGFSPTPTFDVSFYAQANEDAKESGIGWFAHFIKVGKGDGRYENRERLRADGDELLELTGRDRNLRLGNILHARNPLATRLGLDAVEAHLAFLWRAGEKLVPDFEDLTYHRLYGFERDLGAPPLLHYMRVGRYAGFFRNRKDLEVHTDAVKAAFDESYYEEQGRLNESIPAIEEYCAVGWRRGLSPNRGFDPGFYLDLYSDIRQGQIPPFYHYITSGMNEGRLPRPVFEKMVTPGDMTYDPTKRTILVAVHEASRTGAPLLGLEIGRHLANRFNVVFVPTRGGELIENFSHHAAFVTVPGLNVIQLHYLFKRFTETFDNPLLIANSVETVETAEAAINTSIPTVALLHEFSEYTLPSGKISRIVMAADLVVTPAELVAASAQTEIARVGQNKCNNIRVLVQGKLEELGRAADDAAKALSIQDIRELVDATKDGTKIVLGAGYVQGRKGVDLFVQTARGVVDAYGDDVRFVWVGAGYKPDADTAASVWIKAAIDKLGLKRHVFFLPEQPDLEAIYELSDLFYLSSRLDPFPNVAIDSIAKGRKIVCFEGATGVAEWIADGRLEGAVVDYCDTTKAAAAIAALLREPTLSERNRLAGETLFSMEKYVSSLIALGDEAAKLRAKITRDAEKLLSSSLLDDTFFRAAAPLSVEDRKKNALQYSAWAHKGLVVWNARPGFNEGKYRADHGLAGKAVVPLLHAASRGPSPATHPCHILDAMAEASSDLRVGVHLHLHYSDLAEEFAARFKSATPSAELHITVTSEKARQEVAYSFRNHEAEVFVTVVPNRGRDIGPMLDVLRQHHQDYDVFGHFHGKKSLFVGGETGRLWRSFLLDTLVGTSADTAKIMALFEDDPSLGLAFAEDRLNAGWTENKPVAAELARDMGLTGKLDAYPVYPIGTMFWARTKALAPLIDSKLCTADFPPEPIPDDATKLHAIERLLPMIVSGSNFSWCTVRKKGINRTF